MSITASVTRSSPGYRGKGCARRATLEATRHACSMLILALLPAYLQTVAKITLLVSVAESASQKD